MAGSRNTGHLGHHVIALGLLGHRQARPDAIGGALGTALHERAAAVLTLDPALHGQRLKRPNHRRAAHPELPDELRLGGQHVTGRVLPGLDALLNRAHHLGILRRGEIPAHLNRPITLPLVCTSTVPAEGSPVRRRSSDRRLPGQPRQNPDPHHPRLSRRPRLTMQHGAAISVLNRLADE